MAAKVGILAVNQDISATPEEFMKRPRAEAMERRMFLERINKFLYRRLAIKACRVYADRAPEPQPAKAYIPDSMPPVIDKRLGVRFEDPIKAPAMPRFRRIWSGEKYNQPMLPNGDSASL